MKRFIQTSNPVNAPADQVWQKIAQGDGVENWLPIIKSSTLTDGNHRVCEMHEGGTLDETILAQDSSRTFMYRIDRQQAFPARNITGIMRVEENGPDQSTLHWDVEMVVEDDEVFAELRKNVEQMYAASAANLG